MDTDNMELIDVYDSNKWNDAYIHRKVKEYEEWLKEVTKGLGGGEK